MSTNSRTFAAQTQDIGTGDGWVTLSGTTETYTSDCDLETSGYEGAHCLVEVDFDSTPTDYVDVSVYASLDGTNYDDTAMSKVRMDKATDPNQITLIVRDVAHFRLGIKQSGTTDSHNVRAYSQRWYWSNA